MRKRKNVKRTSKQIKTETSQLRCDRSVCWLAEISSYKIDNYVVGDSDGVGK